MAPGPARKFPPIQNTPVLYSRRDYTDGEAANDNERQYANDNEPKPPLTDIASEFTNRYESAGIQPSTGSRPTVTYKKSSSASGKKIGTTLKYGGKAAKITGKGMQSVGRLVSRTGVGAAVGAPLMASGKALQGGGQLAESAGKSLAKTLPKGANGVDLGKLKNKLVGKQAASRINTTIFSVGFTIWLFQLPLALLSLGGVAITAVAVEGAKTGSMVGAVMSFINPAVGAAVGLTADVLGSVSEDMGYAITFIAIMLTFFVGALTLLSMVFLYISSGIKPLWGDGAVVKISMFILAIIGYFFPILNLFPWFVLYAVAVWWYPK